MKTKRIYSIDLLRMFAALLIFLFHSHLHMGCEYGLLDEIIKQGVIFMILFFIILCEI